MTNYLLANLTESPRYPDAPKLMLVRITYELFTFLDNYVDAVKLLSGFPEKTINLEFLQFRIPNELFINFMFFTHISVDNLAHDLNLIRDKVPNNNDGYALILSETDSLVRLSLHKWKTLPTFSANLCYPYVKVYKCGALSLCLEIENEYESLDKDLEMQGVFTLDMLDMVE